MRLESTLDEACSLVTDGTHYTPKNVGAGVPFLTVKDVAATGIDFNGCSFITEGDYQTARAGNSAPMKGDVLFSKDGTVGKVHVVTTDQPFAVLSSLAILRPNPRKVDARYLGHALRSPSVLNQALKKKTGSAIRRIILSDLRSIRLALPSLRDQRRIADALDVVDRLVAKRRATLALLDSLTGAVFLEMFGDHRDESLAIPLSACAEVVSGVAKGRKLAGRGAVQVPYLRVANVQAGYLNLDEIKTIEALPSEVEELRLLPGDLVLTEGGDFDKLGRGALWNGQIEGCIHQNHVFRVRLDRSRLLPRYFHEYLQSAVVRAYFLRCAKRTTNLASINMGQLRALPVVVPPLGAQQQFVDRAHGVERLRATAQAALRGLGELFASLQHQAFNGRL